MRKLTSVVLVGLMVLGGFIGFLNITAGTVEGAGLADSSWPMFHGNPQHTGLSPYNTSHVDGTLKWNFTTGNIVYSSPAIGGDGTIYVGSGDGKLYAIGVPTEPSPSQICLLDGWWIFIVISIVILLIVGILIQKNPPTNKETFQLQQQSERYFQQPSPPTIQDEESELCG